MDALPGAADSRAAELFEGAHRSQSGLQPCVISFDRVRRILLGDMTGGRHQLIDHPRPAMESLLERKDTDNMTYNQDELTLPLTK